MIYNYHHTIECWYDATEPNWQNIIKCILYISGVLSTLLALKIIHSASRLCIIRNSLIIYILSQNIFVWKCEISFTAQIQATFRIIHDFFHCSRQARFLLSKIQILKTQIHFTTKFTLYCQELGKIKHICENRYKIQQNLK